jgi:hypothetical protein
LGNTFNPQLAGIGVHQLNYVYSFGRCSTQTSFTTEVRFDSATIQYETTVQIRNNVGPTPRLYLTSNQNMPVEIRIYNSVGQLLKSLKYGANRGANLFDIDIQNFSKGIYMLEVYYGENYERKVFKLIR